MIKLIAETAWHHEGDYVFMENLIREICIKSDADYVKLHITLDLDEYMASDHPAYKTLKEWMLTEKQWAQLIGIVQASDKKLMLLLNDTKAIEFAATFEPDLIELHSVCLNVPRLQQSVKNCFTKKTEVIIGVGGCELQEVDAAVRSFEEWKTVLMFGFQNYPTKYEDINLSKIRKIQSLYSGKSFGYADHTGWDEANNEFITTVVAANGMEYVEKHVTTVYGEDRCDFSAAISIEMFNNLSTRLKVIDKLHGDGLLSLNKGEETYSQYGPMKMAAIITKEMEKGAVLTENAFHFTRTRQISDLSQVDVLKLLGCKLTKSICAGEVLRKGDVG